MDEKQSDAGGEGVRIALIGCCVLAAVLAGVLVGSIGSEGIADSPVESSIPSEEVYNRYIGESVNEGSGASGLGALTPGNRANVGGETGVDSPYASNSTEVHFTVESAQPAYWRTGAYGEYTGSGWERSGETTAGIDAVEQYGISDERIEYEVTLQKPATALPTAWRPDSVSGVDSLDVYEDGSVWTSEPLESGASFSGVSYSPEQDPTLLRTTDKSYPEEVEREFTELPSGTPARVETFTDQVTQDADNPYDTAMAIQEWLRSNKDYSLEATQQSGRIADTFIFDMQAGYCEYFATAMATMLRSQDIPSRYVLGYTTGEEVSDNTYEVRGMNAHAWVEVYFEEYGWVKFDPTPGGARLATQQAALQDEQPGTEYDAQDQGSPGETFQPGEVSQSEDLLNPDSPSGGDDPGSDDPGSDDPGSDDPGSDDPGSDGPGSDDPGSDEPQYETSLGSTPVPGEDIEVTVTYDGEPAPQRTVTFNGNVVGTTDRDGTVTGTVPYDEQLRIGVRLDFDVSLTNDTNSAYDVSFNRTPRPGESVELTVTENGEPANAMFVEFNGQDIGITNRNGTLTTPVPLADELRIYIEEFVVTDGDEEVITTEQVNDSSARRRPASPAGTSSVETAVAPPGGGATVFASPTELSMTLVGQDNGTDHEDVYEVETDASLTISGDTIPGAEVTITALVDESPVENGTVLVDGSAVGRTDEGGRATVQLPERSGNVSIAVERESVSANATVQLPELTITVEPTATLVLPFTTATVEASYGNTSAVDAPVMVDGEEVARTGNDGTATVRLPLAASTTITVAANGLSDQSTVEGMLWNLTRVGGILGLLGGVILVVYTKRGGYLQRALTAVVRAPRIAVAYGTWLLVAVTTRGDELLLRAIGRAKQTVKSVFSVLRGRVGLGELTAPLLAWLAAKRSRAGQLLGREAPVTTEEPVEDKSMTVQRAWRRFLDHVSVSEETTQTPDELASHAIEHDGLPARPVLTLRDTFREVEYGSRPATDRLDRVQEAIERIENAIEPDESGGPD